MEGTIVLMLLIFLFLMRRFYISSRIAIPIEESSCLSSVLALLLMLESEGPHLCATGEKSGTVIGLKDPPVPHQAHVPSSRGVPGAFDPAAEVNFRTNFSAIEERRYESQTPPALRSYMSLREFTMRRSSLLPIS